MKKKVFLKHDCLVFQKPENIFDAWSEKRSRLSLSSGLKMSNSDSGSPAITQNYEYHRQHISPPYEPRNPFLPTF